MREFDIISKYFALLTQGRSEADGLKNDAAVLDIPSDKQLVVSSDTLVADVHFFADQQPEAIAKKALRSNLSDLNAMGAMPYCYQLCLSLPSLDGCWLEAFCHALAEDQEQYNIFLSGGDTTSTSGPLSISITVMGLVEQGKAISRSGAKDGDLIVLSHSVGDAYCGLQSLRGELSDVPQSCIDLYYVPKPPMAMTSHLHEYASAALDISDGLLQDLGHIAKASNLTAEVDLNSIQFSKDVRSLIEHHKVTPQELLSGGDDYQLLMAVPPEKFGAFKAIALSKGIDLQSIGVFKSGDADVVLRDAKGSEISVEKLGWSHF